jgi:hypothetical protein
MDDLSTLLGGSGGLLSPEQQGSVNSNAIESMAAALLRAAAPSPYKAKMTTLSGLGDALSAGLLDQVEDALGGGNIGVILRQIDRHREYRSRFPHLSGKKRLLSSVACRK